MWNASLSILYTHYIRLHDTNDDNIKMLNTLRNDDIKVKQVEVLLFSRKHHILNKIIPFKQSFLIMVIGVRSYLE